MGSIKVNRVKLQEALEFTKSLIPERPLITADGNITLEYNGEFLVVIATDGIQGARALVEVEAEPGTANFMAGVLPKNLVKIISKDESEFVEIYKEEPYLFVKSDKDGDFATLALADMRRASPMMAWVPKDPTTDEEIDTVFFSEMLSFLDDFLPEGKDEGAMHAVVVLSNKVAHATNGVNLRGICASGLLKFGADVSLRKRYLTKGVRAIKSIKTEKVRFRNNLRVISISSTDGTMTLVMPTKNKTPPSVPMEYLQPPVNSVTMDMKAAVKGLDRISSSNYNTATTLTGVDITLSGEGDNSSLKMLLDDDKASQTFPCSRTDTGTIEKTLDVKAFYKMLKLFQKTGGTKIELGGEDSRVLRFIDKREISGHTAAFIAVCSYSRKI